MYGEGCKLSFWQGSCTFHRGGSQKWKRGNSSPGRDKLQLLPFLQLVKVPGRERETERERGALQEKEEEKGDGEEREKERRGEEL